MDSLVFLESIARAYPYKDYGKIEIYEEKGNIWLRVNGCIYESKELKKCVDSLVDSFATLWVQMVAEEKSKQTIK